MLYDPTRHEAVDAPPWSAEAAQAAIEEIVRDTLVRRRSVGLWPAHPRDSDGEGLPTTGYKSLYLGSAGVLLALHMLQAAGATTVALDFTAAIDEASAAYRAEPDTGEVVPSYFLGSVGLALADWLVTGRSAAAEAVYAGVDANITNPTNEALWAAPGTMLAAWHLWQATREERWRALYLRNVEQVWNTWLPHESLPCHLWTQDLYGRVAPLLGAGHGFAGNVFALLLGADLLPEAQRETLFERCVATMQATAKLDGNCANWRPTTLPPADPPRLPLVQWCHGAPGMITGCAPFPVGRSPEFEALLHAAGELVWQAGPLTKGHGLCHGTAGNGYALLTLYRRSGNALWLQRARAFAMHAIGQSQRMHRQVGFGRYTLWNGDPGLALYLWDCIHGHDGLAGLDKISLGG